MIRAETPRRQQEVEIPPLVRDFSGPILPSGRITPFRSSEGSSLVGDQTGERPGLGSSVLTFIKFVISSASTNKAIA
jgi:hypothetical protein